MSAYISMLTPVGGYLFTDGAAYDDEGTLRQIIRKVDCSPTAPFAVTTIGSSVIGDLFRPFLCEMAERFGVDAMIEAGLPAFLEDMRSRHEWIESTKGRGNCAAHMVAYSAKRGLVHFNFQTMDEHDETVAQDIKAYTLRMVDRPYTGRGTIFDADKFDGIRASVPGEDITAYMRYFGTAVMERMRIEKGCSMHLKGTGAPLHHMVGGHIDMTIVDAGGTRTERIHVWDDKVGEKISPAKQELTVTPFNGLNRRQRRAAERTQRKSA
jgi:hypothetical protein